MTNPNWTPSPYDNMSDDELERELEENTKRLRALLGVKAGLTQVEETAENIKVGIDKVDSDYEEALKAADKWDTKTEDKQSDVEVKPKEEKPKDE